jgi:TPR repeat protein
MSFGLRLLAACLITLMTGIVSAQSSGTAFAVAPGLLITNHHVIEGCGAIEVIASDGRRPATVVDSVQQIDLALLQVYGLRGGVAALRTEGAAQLGEPATVFGFPLAGALSSTGNFTTGVVSSLRGLRDAAGEIQITAPVQPGNSGGPVLDRAGAVIGVVQSKLDAVRAVRSTGDIPQNVNFAVSLDVLTDFLAKNSVSFTAAGRQAALETTRVAEMAQTFTYKISCTAASRTATAPRPQAPPPTTTGAPKPDKLVQDIQAALNQKGFNAGPADGIIGSQTQAAISSAQRTLGLLVTGVPSDALLASIKGMAAIVTGNSMRDALTSYRRKDYPTAFAIWFKFAQAGDSAAQVNLGRLYAGGLGVLKDEIQAKKWFELAAAKGYSLGQLNLGQWYSSAYGANRDYIEAVKWFKLAADKGNVTAQSALGGMYENGARGFNGERGIAIDYVEAIKWFKQAAAQGDYYSYHALSRLYNSGRGVPKDAIEGERWRTTAPSAPSFDAVTEQFLATE